MVPGVRVSTGRKNEPNVSIHGFDQSRILVLIDGVPYYETKYGKFDMNLLSIENVARIDVIKGAASVLYGANAEAGVINIITKKAADRASFSGKLEVGEDGASELSRRSRGTPRIVNRLLKRVRDYAQVRRDGVIDKDTVEEALALEGVDKKGLTNLDRRYIKTIIDFYRGGPVGIEAIAATLQEESDTLVDVVEPFLLKIGFIARTSSGRKASEEAYRHLGYCVGNGRHQPPG